MATVKLQETPVETSGTLPELNTKAPNVTFTKNDLSEIQLSDYLGKRVILSVFPSVDTGTCATSVRTFNQKASQLNNTAVLCISADLPFAQSRFCGAEGIESVEILSTFRSGFGETYGINFVNGPLKGLLSRCIIVLDIDGTVIHTQQVEETADEPNYAQALEAIGS